MLNSYEILFTECVCNTLGTADASGYCDRETGQCPCLPNVVGVSCDRCAPKHWNISSKTGCVPCNCDPLGSHAFECNEVCFLLWFCIVS